MPTTEQVVAVIVAVGMGAELSRGHWVVAALGVVLALALVGHSDDAR